VNDLFFWLLFSICPQVLCLIVGVALYLNATNTKKPLVAGDTVYFSEKVLEVPKGANGRVIGFDMQKEKFEVYCNQTSRSLFLFPQEISRTPLYVADEEKGATHPKKKRDSWIHAITKTISAEHTDSSSDEGDSSETDDSHEGHEHHHHHHHHHHHAKSPPKKRNSLLPLIHMGHHHHDPDSTNKEEHPQHHEGGLKSILKHRGSVMHMLHLDNIMHHNPKPEAVQDDEEHKDEQGNEHKHHHKHHHHKHADDDEDDAFASRFQSSKWQEHRLRSSQSRSRSVPYNNDNSKARGEGSVRLYVDRPSPVSSPKGVGGGTSLMATVNSAALALDRVLGSSLDGRKQGKYFVKPTESNERIIDRYKSEEREASLARDAKRREIEALKHPHGTGKKKKPSRKAGDRAALSVDDVNHHHHDQHHDGVKAPAHKSKSFEADTARGRSEPPRRSITADAVTAIPVDHARRQSKSMERKSIPPNEMDHHHHHHPPRRSISVDAVTALPSTSSDHQHQQHHHEEFKAAVHNHTGTVAIGTSKKKPIVRRPSGSKRPMAGDQNTRKYTSADDL
jgi:hypothetical protein